MWEEHYKIKRKSTCVEFIGERKKKDEIIKNDRKFI